MSDHESVWNEENAEWYVANYGEHISNALTIKNAGLKKDDHLLDIGCGSGAACREAIKFITKGSIIGIDPTPAMIRFAIEKTDDPSIQYMEGSAEDIPLKDDSVTICTAINSLHHWSDHESGFREIQRVLKPNGRLIISDEIVDGGTCGHGDGPLSDPEKVINELEKVGFTDVSLERHEKDGEEIYMFRAKNISS